MFGSAACVISLILVFFFGIEIVDGLLRSGVEAAGFVLLLSIMGGGVFFWVRYASLGGIFARFTRFTAAGVLLLLLLDPIDTTLSIDDPVAAQTQFLIQYGYYVAVIVAIVSLFRPSFLFFPATYVMMAKLNLETISGFASSTLDIRYLVEIAQFCSFSACALAVIQRALQRVKFDIDLDLVATSLAFAGIGLHLGNYFWSGIAKVEIGPTPLYWVMENQTQNIMLPSMYLGVIPFSSSSDAVAAVFDGLGAMVVPSNLLVVVFQILAIAAVVRLVLLRAVTVYYDVMHIGIYLVSGAFFWPWIWNNLAVLYCLRGREERDIGQLPRLTCIVVTALGFWQFFGDSARLAWFDVQEAKLAKFQVRVAESSDWIDVPSAFFLTHSYPVAHTGFFVGETSGHYPRSFRGSTYSLERQQTSGQCPAPTPIARPETAAEEARRIARIGQFVRAHHEKMLGRSEYLPDAWFYVRLPHFLVNPVDFSDFNAISLKNVEEYRFLTESLCFSLEQGRLKTKVIAQTEYRYDVGAAPSN